MNLFLRALQTNGKLFSNFGIIFRMTTFFFNNSGVGVMHARWGEAFVLNSTGSI